MTKQSLKKEFDEKFFKRHDGVLACIAHNGAATRGEIIDFFDQAYDRIREEALREAIGAVENSRERHGTREEVVSYILGRIQSLITKK